MVSSLNPELSTSLRVIVPVIYILFALIGILGNLIVFQIICANRFRHKSIHLLIASIIIADFCYIIIFTVVRSVSYAYLDTAWFINVNEWCKAEMFLLKLFDFVTAYTIVFICVDRAVVMGSCWFGIRKFRAGISIAISIWVASFYVLIPILLFKQTIFTQTNGGYLCYSTDESVPLFWLGNFPRRILDFIDIVFRVFIPIFLMIILIIIALVNLKRTRKEVLETSLNRTMNATMLDSNLSGSTSHLPIIKSNSKAYGFLASNKRMLTMTISYFILFSLCQLPYAIYRSILLWQNSIETDLWERGFDFAIEVPLLILMLVNKCINPFLFICFADPNGFRKNFFRLWCCPCFPCCMGCDQCWFTDCCATMKYECNHCLGDQNALIEEDWVPTGVQTVCTEQYRDGEKLVTKQRILEEYETGVEAYYKNPGIRENHSNEAFDSNETINSARTLQGLSPEDRIRVKL